MRSNENFKARLFIDNCDEYIPDKYRRLIEWSCPNCSRIQYEAEHSLTLRAGWLHCCGCDRVWSSVDMKLDK